MLSEWLMNTRFFLIWKMVIKIMVTRQSDAAWLGGKS